MSSPLYIAEIIICAALILVILVQTRGAGGLGGIFGGVESSGWRTRRGVEATLFRFTIILAVVFVVMAAVVVKLD